MTTLAEAARTEAQAAYIAALKALELAMIDLKEKSLAVAREKGTDE